MPSIKTSRARALGLLVPVLLGACCLLAIAPATGAAKATGPGTYSIIPKIQRVDAKPGGPFLGSLQRGQTFIVTRLSVSGKYAYGHSVGKLRYLTGWVPSASLKRRAGPQFTG